MMKRIINILSNLNNINGWKTTETIIESSELFFIKKDLDMNRSKKVQHFEVIVYKDFEENGKKYRGSSSAKIHPSMKDEEIKKAIQDAAFSASFVKNEYYPLVKPMKIQQPNIESNFSSKDISEWLPKLTEAIFKKDNYKNGSINSVEIFLNKIHTRIINSEGVDVNFNKYKGEIEFIVNWKENNSEEVELYKHISFSDFNQKMIEEKIEEMLLMATEKALAQPTPSLKKHTILLSGAPVKEFFKYYYVQSNSQYVYEKISNAKLQEKVQGNEVRGDLINIKLDPFIDNSTESIPYDKDGFPLKKVTLYENGILVNYSGDIRHSYYLGVEPTGLIKNMIIEGGSKSVEELKKDPYLEIVAFSDFQMDPLTGNFGGEIRLGWYYDGNTTIPVTGGSISGNINEVHDNMYLSKEIQKDNNFIGPKTIQLFDVNVSGSK